MVLSGAMTARVVSKGRNQFAVLAATVIFMLGMAASAGVIFGVLFSDFDLTELLLLFYGFLASCAAAILAYALIREGTMPMSEFLKHPELHTNCACRWYQLNSTDWGFSVTGGSNNEPLRISSLAAEQAARFYGMAVGDVISSFDNESVVQNTYTWQRLRGKAGLLHLTGDACWQQSKTQSFAAKSFRGRGAHTHTWTPASGSAPAGVTTEHTVTLHRAPGQHFGFQLQTTEHGLVYVDNVVPGSPASIALQPGDLIRFLNGEPAASFMSAWTQRMPDAQTTLEVRIQRQARVTVQYPATLASNSSTMVEAPLPEAAPLMHAGGHDLPPSYTETSAAPPSYSTKQ